ncbi:FkbM family methyltransferase [Roseospirillum parvum]|uniref:Methyltransferase, FkbM family n=1 Tax=Roseospirillum parvum TaxID=83401 RepID=A0A1G7V471_9PROT|nr:FkbM family methyltransferase [Roseospirillum parvum]SDG54544.1 methyltransferase, FkbM family [Roseospirillum parvum]
MPLTTRQKVAIARLLAAGLLGARRLLGQGPEATATRGGLVWQLDLREGIDLAVYLGRYEPDALALYRRLVRPGMTVLDIGANLGFHSLHLARMVGPEGRVVAVEPTAFAHAKLLANLSLNPELAGRVRPVQAMLTARAEDALETEIHASWPVSGKAEVHETLMSQAKSTEGARALPLDALVAEQGLQRLDLVKLDVDGHEVTVLEGARDTLARFKPLIYAEFCPHLHGGAEGFRRLVATIDGLGYGAALDTPGRPPHRLDAEAFLKAIPHGGGTNVLLVPLEGA